ncbi:MAG: O-antigen ligase family protein [Bacteroides thetaiotaomicron]|nr:O-antigen ligase family protein [Bacteroides thetaiotaomicron]
MDKYFSRTGFLVFLFLPFFNPMAFKYIPALTGVYDAIQVWKLIAIILVIIIYFLRGTFSVPVLLVLLFEIISVVTSLINGVYDNKVFTNFFLVIGISMLTELAIQNNKEKTIQILTDIMLLLATINCVLCIVYPTGLRMATLYTNWTNPLYLTSIDNGMIKELLPLLVLVYYSRFCDCKDAPIWLIRKRARNLIFANLISIITLLIVDSAAGLAVYVIFTALTMGYSLIVKMKYPYRLMIAIYILFFVAVVLAGINSSFLTSITSALGRSNTFTGRASLWYGAVNLIMSRPWVGYGYTAGNINIWGGSYSSHNMFLELMIQGGIIYFAIFLCIIFYAFSRCRKASTQFSNLFFAAMYCFMLEGLVETGAGFTLFMIVIMMCYPDFDDSIRTVRFRIG